MYSEIILGLVFSIIICFGIPIIFIIYFVKSKSKVIVPLLVGVVSFFISQMVLRIPILNMLLKDGDIKHYAVLYPIVYLFILSFTAGIFEEISRFICFKCLKKHRRWIDGMAFGVGHGGIEAILIVGLNAIVQIKMILDMENGIFDSTRYGISEEFLRASLNNVNTLDIYLGGIERIFAIALHIGLSLLVLYGVKKKSFKYLVLAIGIHTGFNFIAVYLINNGISPVIVEGILFLFSIAMVIYIKKSKEMFNKLENENNDYKISS